MGRDVTCHVSSRPSWPQLAGQTAQGTTGSWMCPRNSRQKQRWASAYSIKFSGPATKTNPHDGTTWHQFRGAQHSPTIPNPHGGIPRPTALHRQLAETLRRHLVSRTPSCFWIPVRGSCPFLSFVTHCPLCTPFFRILASGKLPLFGMYLTPY